MHTVEYYTTMKKIKSYTCYNMSELENTVLRGKKKSQIQKTMYIMIPFM